MKIKLSLVDRLHFHKVLPEQSDFITLSIKNGIVDKIKITEKEIKSWDVKLSGTQYTWNANKAKEVEFDFNDAEMEIIKKQLETLDKAKKLDDSTFSLYKKIVK